MPKRKAPREKETLSRYDTVDYLESEADIAAYLEAILEDPDEDPRVIGAALGDVVRARALMELAKQTGVAREALRDGNPSYGTVAKVMKALGYRLVPQRIENPPATRAHRRPITPGEILRKEFLNELGVSASALAKALRIPTSRVSRIVDGTRAITADTALRLSRFFGTTPQFWMNAQAHYDLTVATRRDGKRIAREVAKVGSTDGLR